MREKAINGIHRIIFTGFISAVILFVLVIGCAKPPSIEEEPKPTEEEVTDTTETGEAEPVVELGTVATFAGDPNQLTAGEYDNGIGSFHPSGDRIVFQSNRDGRWQIYEINLLDNSERRLISSESNDEHPVWSLDNTLVLFVSDRDGDGSEWSRDIYFYDPVAEVTARLTDAEADDWNPIPLEGEYFAFLSERDADPSLPIWYRQNSMFIGSVDSEELNKLIGADIDPSAPVRWKDDSFILRTPQGELLIWSQVDKSTEMITPSRMKCGSATVHTGKNWLAFCAREEEVYQLYLMDIASRTIQTLDTIGDDIRFPQFSPDGNMIVYTGKIDGHFQLLKIDLE
ncbi:PD40 domain-containing protein [bacterium]|nr:PD40 domain-containing protein [bacterium]